MPKRIGLVGYACHSGQGELNRQIAANAEINLWLIKPHHRYGTHIPEDCLADVMTCPVGQKVEQFVKSVDTVVFVESPIYRNLIDTCKQYGRRIVVIPMQEWMPPGAMGWPEECDLFICPTKHCYDQFQDVAKCVYFPWPIPIERYNFHERAVCSVFLFINGHGGWKGRKGLETVIEAKRLCPELYLSIATQIPVHVPLGMDKIHIWSEMPEGSDLYGYGMGDVLLCPHKVDGIGLEPLEAMASGMPVVTTDGLPWTENPALARIPAVRTKRRVGRPTNWYIPDAEALGRLCRDLVGQDIAKASRDARSWAESRAWKLHAERFNQLVRGEV